MGRRKGECAPGWDTLPLVCIVLQLRVVLYCEDRMLMHYISHFFPFCAVESVLKDFRELFIECMDANVVTYDLKEAGVISAGDINDIEKTTEPKQQNQILYDRLLQKCTGETLMTVCDKIVAVGGNPRMKKLGIVMQSKLSGKLCVCKPCICMRHLPFECKLKRSVPIPSKMLTCSERSLYTLSFLEPFLHTVLIKSTLPLKRILHMVGPRTSASTRATTRNQSVNYHILLHTCVFW